MELVLRRLFCFLRSDKTAMAAFSDALDVMLDDAGDLFGTEGQLDPRGDQRDSRWTMKQVQGIDD